MTAAIPTWTQNPDAEQAMEDGHGPLWERLIELVVEPSLAHVTVLDFGCNQGGFLRRLHACKGFTRAVGIDIAAGSVAVAEARKGGLPITYLIRDNLDGFAGEFDVGFSHEVVYLLPDLERHAREVFASLKPGGVYYAVTGCHSDNPEWSAWRADIRARCNVPPVDRSLDDYARSFAAAGFAVTARKFGLDAFMPVPQGHGTSRSIVAQLNYYDNVKICFRLIKKGG